MKPRNIINYGLAILLTIFVFKLYTEKPSIDNGNLSKLTITAKENIKTYSGRYAKFGYSFLTNEYPSTFTIDNCINFVSERSLIKEIKGGDKLEVMIDNYYQDNLSDIKTEIPIFSLNINNNQIFTPDRYVLGQKKQNYRRISLFSILILALIIFNIKKIKPAINWIILIAYAILILFLIEKKIL